MLGVDVDYERHAIITALVSVFVVAVVIVVIFTAVRVYLMRCQFGSATADEGGTESSAVFLAACDSVSTASRSNSPDLDGLKVDQLISHGRYGDVYRGLLGANEVAVKVILSLSDFKDFLINICDCQGCRTIKVKLTKLWQVFKLGKLR